MNKKLVHCVHQDFFIATKMLVLNSNAGIQTAGFQKPFTMSVVLQIIVRVVLLSINKLIIKVIAPFCCFTCFILYLSSYFINMEYFKLY